MSSGIDDSLAPPAETLYLVDGFNFSHAVMLEKGERATFRAAAQRLRLVELFAGASVRGLLIVDAHAAPAPANEVFLDALVAAARSREFPLVETPDADATILRLLGVASAPSWLCVVTADRSLADRARHRGAKTLSPFRFADLVFGGSPRDARRSTPAT